MNKILKDRLGVSDSVSQGSIAMPPLQSHGLWAKTVVMGSHDDVETDKNGISHFVKKTPIGKSSLGETIFKTEKVDPEFSESNMVPIGGCQYAMEQLFGVQGTQITVPTMYDNNGIGLANSLAPTETYDTPKGARNIIYRYGHFVQLFGIGITGTAENDITVHPVDYRENDITLNRVTTDGLTLTGTMLPFRYTAETLSKLERAQYFGKKTFDDGKTGYYLKRFETDPVIKHIWKTGTDVDEETLVSSEDVWQNNVGLNAVESFTECVLKVTKTDVKEWFIDLEQEDRTRLNTIALFNGQYYKENETDEFGDYRDVRLFSKLNIPTEYLTLSKDLNIIYRVYTS
jgi:hypothetical protein